VKLRILLSLLLLAGVWCSPVASLGAPNAPEATPATTPPPKRFNFADVRRRAEGTRELGTAESHHRRVYYEEPDAAALDDYIAALRQEAPYVDQIEAMLTAYDIAAPAAPRREWPELQLSGSEIRLRQLRQYTKDQVGRIRYAFRGSRSNRRAARAAAE